MTYADPPDIIVFGPVRKGELTIAGKPYEASGWGWACGTCKSSRVGLPSEDDADFDALAHECLGDEERAE